MMAGEDRPPLTGPALAKRTAIVAVVAAVVLGLAVFSWVVSAAWLVLFIAILFAVLLDGMTRLAMRWLHLPRPLGLLLAILLLTACIAGVFAFGGLRVASEAPQLRRSLQNSIQRIQHQLRGSEVEHKLHDIGIGAGKSGSGSTSAKAMPAVSAIFSRVQGYLSNSVEVVADLFIVIVAGIYFAAAPGFYIDTVLRLVPERRRDRLRVVAREVGHGLRRWLLGVFVSMLAVGIIAGIGLTLLHVPLAALLAIIATILTFIPYLGTIISTVPALLIALLVSPTTMLYVLLLYLFAHAVEGYVVTPLIQSRTVRLAPGWLILAQLVGGLVAGVFGVLVAAPLLVTVTIIVQLLYVEDVMGDTTRTLGESNEKFRMRRLVGVLRERARRRQGGGPRSGGDAG